MTRETITFHSPDAGEASGEAEVLRFSAAGRVALATLYVLGGLLGATACIIIPGVHFITTWALPLLGVIMAVRTVRRDLIVHQPHGRCPSCGKHIELTGGPLDDPHWQKCPQCQAVVQIRVNESPTDTHRAKDNASA